MSSGCRSQQEDEFLVLQSIYGEESVERTLDHCITVHVPDISTEPKLILSLTLPEDYPAASHPIVEIHSNLLDSEAIGELAGLLEELYTPGEVVLFDYIEAARSRWEEIKPPPEPPITETEQSPAAQLARYDGDLPPNLAKLGIRDGGGGTMGSEEAELASRIIHGEPFTVQKSTFQAHICPVTSVEQVHAVVDILLQNNKIRAATHNMMAYRIQRPSTTATASGRALFLQDCDDDGEAAAGGRLLHLLEMIDARDVVVIVSRWFGGVLLGPARFGHINNTARQLLVEYGYVKEKKGGGFEGKGQGKSKK